MPVLRCYSVLQTLKRCTLEGGDISRDPLKLEAISMSTPVLLSSGIRSSAGSFTLRIRLCVVRQRRRPVGLVILDSCGGSRPSFTHSDVIRADEPQFLHAVEGMLKGLL
jgi:hypothetical protein